MGFGGTWEQRDNVDTFTLVITAANEFVAPLHDRMPLILPREVHQRWLFGEPDDTAKLMVSAPDTTMAAQRVSDRATDAQFSRAANATRVEPRCGFAQRIRGDSNGNPLRHSRSCPSSC